MIRPMIENDLAREMLGELVVELDNLTPITNKIKFKPGFITCLGLFQEAGLSEAGQSPPSAGQPNHG